MISRRSEQRKDSAAGETTLLRCTVAILATAQRSTEDTTTAKTVRMHQDRSGIEALHSLSEIRKASVGAILTSLAGVLRLQQNQQPPILRHHHHLHLHHRHHQQQQQLQQQQ
mmetsp:Transcript_75721/g.136572  ORF Transcript_75721/g.136572 Transcript_75721/m.136572 type:complete len:112 (+) Transcript_75721:412-747(+)